MSGSVAVVNFHHLPGKKLPDDSHVYIGRPRAGGVLGLGNPIELKDHNNDRDAVIQAYKSYAKTQWLQAGSSFRPLVEALAKRVYAGEDLKLVCWCAPKTCHGDVLKSAIETLVRGYEQKAQPTPRRPSA